MARLLRSRLIHSPPPEAPPVVAGRPFGTFNFYVGTGINPHTEAAAASFNLGHTSIDSANIITQINNARSNGHKLILVMTAGHSRFLDPHPTLAGRTIFSMAKWEAVQSGFFTTPIKNAIAAAVLDGTVVGATTIDEPNHRDFTGSITKADCDAMARFIKAQMPTLPVGVTVVHWWRNGLNGQPMELYEDIDFIIDQYDWWQRPNGAGGGGGGISGDIVAWKNRALEVGVENGIRICFSMNILAGSIQDVTDPIVWDCPTSFSLDPIFQQTGGFGPFSPTCRHSPGQLRFWGETLIRAGNGLLMWRWDTEFMVTDATFAALNRQKFVELRAIANTLTPILWTRP